MHRTSDIDRIKIEIEKEQKRLFSTRRTLDLSEEHVDRLTAVHNEILVKIEILICQLKEIVENYVET